MASQKHHYSEQIRQWMLHNNRPLGSYDIAELLGNSFLKCQTGEIAGGGFKVTRIFPFNRHVFTDVDFAPSEDSNTNEITLQALKASKGRSNSKNSAALSSSHGTQQGTEPKSSQDFTPSAQDLADSGPSRCSSTVNFSNVSPQDILPIPKPKKRVTNKGPKPMTCAVVTSSPYKHALEEAEKNKIERATKKVVDLKKKECRGKSANKRNYHVQ